MKSCELELPQLLPNHKRCSILLVVNLKLIHKATGKSDIIAVKSYANENVILK